MVYIQQIKMIPISPLFDCPTANIVHCISVICSDASLCVENEPMSTGQRLGGFQVPDEEGN